MNLIARAAHATRNALNCSEVAYRFASREDGEQRIWYVGDKGQYTLSLEFDGFQYEPCEFLHLQVSMCFFLFLLQSKKKFFIPDYSLRRFVSIC